MLIIILNYKNFSNKIILIQLKLNFKKESLPNAIKSVTYSVTSNPSEYIYNKNHGKSTVVCLLLHHNSSIHVFIDVSLYATLRGCISVGDTLIDVWFITGIVLLSGIHIQSFKETFFMHCGL